jgi:hypothetical protein
MERRNGKRHLLESTIGHFSGKPIHRSSRGERERFMSNVIKYITIYECQHYISVVNERCIKIGARKKKKNNK